MTKHSGLPRKGSEGCAIFHATAGQAAAQSEPWCLLHPSMHCLCSQQQEKLPLSKGKGGQVEKGTQPQEQTGWGRDLTHGQMSQRGKGGKQIAWLRRLGAMELSFGAPVSVPSHALCSCSGMWLQGQEKPPAFGEPLQILGDADVAWRHRVLGVKTGIPPWLGSLPVALCSTGRQGMHRA